MNNLNNGGQHARLIPALIDNLYHLYIETRLFGAAFTLS